MHQILYRNVSNIYICRNAFSVSYKLNARIRVIVDTHQYVLHRLAHTYTFMYKYMHSHHHRLYVPYAFGALYNHPLEGFLLDSCGAALAFELTGMSPRLGMWFFVFSTLKTSKRERERKRVWL